MVKLLGYRQKYVRFVWHIKRILLSVNDIKSFTIFDFCDSNLVYLLMLALLIFKKKIFLFEAGNVNVYNVFLAEWPARQTLVVLRFGI